MRFSFSLRRGGWGTAIGGHGRLGLVAAALMIATIAPAEEIWRVDQLGSLGGHAVTLVGSPRAAEIAGRPAVAFDGVDDGLVVTVNPLAEATAFTIEAMIYPAADGPKEQRFLHIEDAAGRRALLETRVDAQRGWWLDGFVRSSANPTDKGLALIDPTLVHPADRWHWVALRYDGERLTTFVNGRKELEGQRAFLPIGAGKLSLGVRQNLIYWFKGGIAEVRFHREAVPAEKLQR